MEIILTPGKKTNKELAEWFGITQGSFNNNKAQKLKELKYFANFHMEGKKVVIDEVLNPGYTKLGGINYQRVKNEIDPNWNKNGLDSCKRVSQIINEKLSKEENFHLKGGTVYEYTRKGRDELYGKPFSGGGEIGKCEYVWCKRTEDGNYEFLNDIEKGIRDKLIKKYFGNTTEKQLLVKQMVEDGELKTEEAFDYLNELTGMTDGKFMMFLHELQESIGCQIVRGTYVERNAFLQEAVE